MIKINKGNQPAVLVANAEQWRQEIAEKIRAGEDISASLKSRYNNPEIKEAIVTETNGKCAYCESKVRHIAPGDIEHIVPKSVEPDLWFEWTNLTLACPICNNKKRANVGLVDPHLDEPSEHFWFVGSTVFPKSDSAKGILTVTTLGLNRSDLLDRRHDRILRLGQLVNTAATQNNQQVKQILQEDLIENETKDDCEYAAMSRAFVENARSLGLLP